MLSAIGGKAYMPYRVGKGKKVKILANQTLIKFWEMALMTRRRTRCTYTLPVVSGPL